MIALCGELGSCFVRLLNQWDIRRYSKSCEPLLTLTGKNDVRECFFFLLCGCLIFVYFIPSC